MIPRDLVPFAVTAIMMILWVKIGTKISMRMDSFTRSSVLSELILLIATMLGFFIAQSVGLTVGIWW